MMDKNSQSVAQLINAIRKGELASRVDRLRESAARGDDLASIALGYIYFRGGNGVSRDYSEALSWFCKVNLDYDPTGFAASHLAIIYYKGLGVAKNHRMATKYLRSAALCGSQRSKILFALLQKRGDGTLRKPRSADVILRASACDRKLSVITRFWALVWLFY